MRKILFLSLIMFQVLYSKDPNVETYFYSLFPAEDYTIEEKDLRNGYIRFHPKMAEGFSEFTIWKLKDKSTLAGVVFFSCGPACSVTGLEFYYFPLNSTKSKKVTSQIFDKKKMDSIYKKVLEDMSEKGRTGEETLWIKLPRRGLDIQFGIMQDPVEMKRFILVGIGKFNGKGFDIEAVKK